MKGYVLISWMLQLFLCTLVAILSFSLCVQWHKKLFDLSGSLNNMLIMPTALDVLTRDMQTVNFDSIKVSSNQIEIVNKLTKVRWLYQNNKLFRIMKNYDRKKNRWRNANRSLAALHIESLQFKGIYNNHVKSNPIGIEILYAHAKKKIKRCIIGLRSGKVI